VLAATVRGAKSPNVPLNSDSNRRTKEIRRWPEDAALIITSPDFHPSRVGRRTMTTHGVANLKCATVPGPRFLSGSRAPKSTRPLFAASEPYEDLSFSSNR